MAHVYIDHVLTQDNNNYKAGNGHCHGISNSVTCKIIIVHNMGIFMLLHSSVALVRFTANDYTVNEDDRHVQIGVQLLTVTERPIVVTLMLEPGSAQRKYITL
jgi:hypothetical protein